jgi:hypothetical protein
MASVVITVRVCCLVKLPEYLITVYLLFPNAYFNQPARLLLGAVAPVDLIRLCKPGYFIYPFF